MKPLIFYVDDEPHNLTVFEASLPDQWDIKTYDNPLDAIKDLEKYQPCVVVSDQRMPGMTGVSFLEVVKKIVPYAIRIIVTGYSDEDLVVESVRKAQVFDYIRKPWDPNDLQASINIAIEYFHSAQQSRQLQAALILREQELQEQTIRLLKLTNELEQANKREMTIRKELECWVPPFVLWALKDNEIKFPISKDLVGITFDIVDSSKYHDVNIDGQSVRSRIIQMFSESIIKHGGWRESHSGDSAYGHFGLLHESINPFESAFAVAREFRVGLRGLASVYGVKIECGIALHKIENATVDVHTVLINSPKGVVTQKSFDTTSADIDHLHRMEKLTHQLPGTNIIMSDSFLNSLLNKPTDVISLGNIGIKGKDQKTGLYLLKSDQLKDEDLSGLLSTLKAA